MTFFLRLSSEAPDFDRVERERGFVLNLREGLSESGARLLRDRLERVSWRDSWDEPTCTSTSMGSCTSTDASLEEDDMGLSAVRESSCPLKEESAPGEDRVEEREGAGWMSMQRRGMGQGDKYLGEVDLCTTKRLGGGRRM